MQGPIDVSSSLLYLGELEVETARPAQAVASLRRSLEIRDQALANRSGDRGLLWKQAQAWEALGKAYTQRRSPACRDAFSRAEAIAREFEQTGTLAASEKLTPARLSRPAATCVSAVEPKG